MAKKAAPKKKARPTPETSEKIDLANSPITQASGASPAADNHLCTIVGVGASAGGLEAFSEMLANMPPDPGMALVLVQHLDPHHESLLTELLSRETPLHVQVATNGVIPQPNNVYVIPANKTLVLEQGVLQLQPRLPGNVPPLPIDAFLRSLAQSEGSKAIGVILSGTASDGTLGLKAIKAEGGITFCQDLESAKYDGMPRSAIAAGCVDFVLTPHDIAHELVRLCRHPYAAPLKGKPEESGQELDFGEILTMLRTATGVDFTFYKHATIRRRILRRMALNRVDTPERYAAFLRQNRGEVQSLFQDILINVTEFFREPAMFDFLKSRVFPSLCANRKNDDPIRIWVPGCSTGEEAYSVAIALLEYLRERSTETTVQIFGTDLSEIALETARAGIYPESIASEVSAERLRKFFSKVNGSYQISRAVRDLCIFARQNLTKDPPFSKLDLITCRNVLIYLGPVLQQRVMRVFHYALKPSGYLALGQSETVGAATDFFYSVDRRQRVYARKSAPATVALDLSSYEETPAAPAPRKGPDWSSAEFQRRIDQLLLNRYAPPGVVVNADLKILEFRGRTAPFLEHGSGEANLNLLLMSRGGLGLEVRKLVQKAKLNNGLIRGDTLQIGVDEAVRNVRISVIAVNGADNEEPQFVVLFEEVPPPEKSGKPPKERGPASPASRKVKELEQELGSTKLYLQSVIEEQEATTEELKSANEEIQSSNEELQSINEELLTAKEELQSTNEELTTVNEEMRGRNAELTQIGNDLSNLLSSVNIPIVMLGNDLRIRRFTPQAEKVLNLLSTDIGRPISDLRPKINVPDLDDLFMEVIDSLAVREREVQDQEGRYYSMWVRPLRTAENKIDGAVMALFDVTERKSLAEARFRRLFETARDGILILDGQTGEILDANPFVFNLLGYQRSDLVGRRASHVGLLPPPELQDLIGNASESKTWLRTLTLYARSGEPLDVEIVGNAYQEIGKRVLQLNIRDLASRRYADVIPRDGQKLEIVNRFAGPLSAGLNSQLSAISGYTERVETKLGAVNPAAGELKALERAAEKASQLTRQLLAFGRKPTAGISILDLNEIAFEIEQVARVMLPPGVEFDLKISSEPVLFKANRFQIEEIVLDLVATARDGMARAGKITVEIRRESVDQEFARLHPAVVPGDYGVLHVSDTGPGGALAARSNGPAARVSGGGAFDAIQAAVRAASGFIWSYTESGRGTQIAVYFPTVAAEASNPEEPNVTGSETILVVDPEAGIRDLIASELRSCGYSVVLAASSAEALELQGDGAGKIQLLLTEAIQPVLSGSGLATRMKLAQPDLRVLFMSGSTDAAICETLSHEERSQLIRKPFRARQLAGRIRAALDS